MSAADRLLSSIDTLTEKELEILRLLTAGHTVKSIAVRLGRSETSINERLRDARRKTGIGSSRELARRLDAQKVWDKKIDLSARGPTGDRSAQSPVLRRLTSKGTIIMLFASAAAAAGLVFAASGSMDQAAPPPAVQVAARDRVPLVVGKWSLDVSRLPAEGRPRSVTLEFRVSDDEVWTGRSDIVTADGSRQHAEATAAADGLLAPLTGNMTFADRVSMRQPAPNTLVLTFTKDGDPVSTRVYTVESDGKAMKETIVWAGDVTPRMVTTYFHRVD
jgi:DNA-binding CsgD family transcriptional regulator